MKLTQEIRDFLNFPPVKGKIFTDSIKSYFVSYFVFVNPHTTAKIGKKMGKNEFRSKTKKEAYICRIKANVNDHFLLSNLKRKTGRKEETFGRYPNSSL